jgi:hypothetical protein
MVSLVEMGVGDVLGISRDRNEDEIMNHEELDFWSVYVSVRFMCTALYLYSYNLPISIHKRYTLSYNMVQKFLLQSLLPPPQYRPLHLIVSSLHSPNRFYYAGAVTFQIGQESLARSGLSSHSFKFQIGPSQV